MKKTILGLVAAMLLAFTLGTMCFTDRSAITADGSEPMPLCRPTATTTCPPPPPAV